jgi:hypothetical protein
MIEGRAASAGAAFVRSCASAAEYRAFDAGRQGGVDRLFPEHDRLSASR